MGGAAKTARDDRTKAPRSHARRSLIRPALLAEYGGFPFDWGRRIFIDTSFLLRVGTQGTGEKIARYICARFRIESVDVLHADRKH